MARNRGGPRLRASLVVHELASGVGPLTGQRHAIEHRHHEGSHERDGLEGAGCFGSVNHDFDEVRHEGIQWGTGPRLRVRGYKRCWFAWTSRSHKSSLVSGCGSCPSTRPPCWAMTCTMIPSGTSKKIPGDMVGSCANGASKVSLASQRTSKWLHGPEFVRGSQKWRADA